MTYTPPTKTNPPFTTPATWPFPTSSEGWEADYRLRLLEYAAILNINPGISGVYNVKMYGAKGDGVTDDTAAIQTALLAAKQNKGIIFYPPGTYVCSASLTYSPNTIWTGCGISATRIWCKTELWNGVSPTPAHFIVPDTGFAQSQNCAMFNFTVQGPGPGAAPGQTPSHTNGIQSSSKFILDNIYIGGGFFAGLECCSDHEKFINVFSGGNYYNLDYSDANPGSRADQAFFSCILTSAGLASIHISGNNFMEGVNFNQLHLGWAPVGIFMTDSQNGWDGSGNPTYVGGTPSVNACRMLSVSMRDVSFEQIGNIAILDIATGANNNSLGYNTLIQGDGLISWNFAAQGTTNAPLNNIDYQATWAILLRNNQSSATIETGGYPFLAPPTTGVGVYKSTVVNAAGPTFKFVRATSGSGTIPPANFFGSGSSWSVGSGGRMMGRMTDIIGGINSAQWGDIIAMACSTALNVGDCVEMVSNGTVQRATGTKPVFGVARTPAPGSVNATVWIQINGYGPINATISTPPVGTPVYLDSTTHYMVQTAVTTTKLVGQTTSTVGTNQVNALIAPANV